MRKREELLRQLHEQGERLEIPESLKPEQMRAFLEAKGSGPVFRSRHFYPAAAAVICLCLTAGILYGMHRADFHSPAGAVAGQQTALDKLTPERAFEEEEKELSLPEMTYGELYARLLEVWEEQSAQNIAMRSSGIDEVASAEAASDLEAASDSAAKQAYGTTNVQVEQVDEGDRIKNDGRYLYQIACIQSEEDGEENWGIQILDTEGGLAQAAFLDDFDSVEEFYVQEDLLIAVECKWLAGEVSTPRAVEDLAVKYRYMQENQYHEISVYNIEDRTRPRKLKTFTLKGSYVTSRISDGYFYGISQFTAAPGEGEEDYEAYVPTVDGTPISAERISCPENAAGTSYLVLVSIDLEEPSSFADSRAVLMGNGICYVSQKNIYMTCYHSVYEDISQDEGRTSDSTELLKLTYWKGKFYAKAQGEIPGMLNDSFSMDEYGGYLRAVTTVQEYTVKKVTDDRTGEEIGNDYTEGRQSSGLYVLNKDLSVAGKIEGLAEDELVYSARFMGDMGYFVTFRQTDPLFSVDLSDPANPVVLGELKVSGFSEYLHFYGEDLLLGIGMEADEETGQQNGMKLSMFDLSDPSELQEEARLNLTDYNYSEALYNHRAVMIDTEENLIGFSAEGSNSGRYWQRYLVFSYEDGAFVKKLEADLKAEDGGYYSTRGTFIGNTLYLLSENGAVRAYDRESGKLVEEI